MPGFEAAPILPYPEVLGFGKYAQGYLLVFGPVPIAFVPRNKKSLPIENRLFCFESSCLIMN
jgi:hypothetical protein